MSDSTPTLPRWRVGFDIGGTFTDFVLFDREGGRVHLHKRLTSSDDPSRSALIGLEELMAKGAITLADVGDIVHGTTLVTNAIIERNGGARRHADRPVRWRHQTRPATGHRQSQGIVG